MISRETFKNALNFIIRIEEYEHAKHNLYKQFDDIFDDWIVPYLNTYPVVSLLNEALNLEVTDDYGSDLEYWLWECDRGKRWNELNPENLFLPEDHKYRFPKINNLDELYDYLVFMGEYNGKRSRNKEA